MLTVKLDRQALSRYGLSVSRRAERRRDRDRRQERRQAVRGRPPLRHRGPPAGKPSRHIWTRSGHLRFRCRRSRTRNGRDDERAWAASPLPRCVTCRCRRSQRSMWRPVPTRSAARTASGASSSPPTCADATSARSSPRRRRRSPRRSSCRPATGSAGAGSSSSWSRPRSG